MVLGWDVEDAPGLYFGMGVSLGGMFSSEMTLQTGIFKGLLTRMERRGR